MMNLEKTHALLIGIGGNKMEATVTDAKSIAEVLMHPQKASYNTENVCLLTEKKATRSAILEKLYDLVKITEKEPDTTVVIYYSGHGGLDSTNNRYYLLPHGYSLSNKRDTMIDGNEFSKLINQIKAKRFLLMLDCCHAAGILNNNETLIEKSKNIGDESIEIINSNLKLLKDLHSGEGRVFITSCDDNEQSFIFPESKNSLFTEVILEALEGCVSQGKEYVSLVDVIYHTLNEVPKRIDEFNKKDKEYNYVQRPIINQIENLTPDYYICKSGIGHVNKIIDYNYSEDKTQKILEGNNIINSNYTTHFLHQFPRGPMVDGYMIDESIIDAYARAIPSTNAHRYIKKANKLRLSADPDDNEATIIDSINLIPSKYANPLDVWENVFDLARLHGPRMLAALLLVAPDNQFKEDARKEKKQLLEKLITHK